MASFPIPAPAAMSLKGDVVGNWNAFVASWHYYSIATGLDQKMKEGDAAAKAHASTIAAATLCSVMGVETLKVMTSLPNLSEEDKQNPERILACLTAHFVPQRHVLFERYKLNSAVQEVGEPIDAFVLRLRQLAESCEFGDLKDSLIRDRLIIGVRDTASRDRLLRERPVPNLVRCTESLKATELSREHSLRAQKMIEPSTDNVDWLQHRPDRTHTRQSSTQSKSKSKCEWCGRDKHPRPACPARNNQCHTCGKSGHFQVVCRSQQPQQSRNIREVHPANTSPTPPSPTHSTAYLGSLSSMQKCWRTKVLVDGQLTEFKVDTGAEVTVLSNNNPILREIAVQPTTQRLRGPDGADLPVMGALRCILAQGERSITETVYVLNGSANLLGKQACESLKIVSVSNSVYEVQADPDQTITSEFHKEFPKLFKGLGKFGEPYHIRLRETAEPLCLFTPRRVAHPLATEVRAELDRMLESDVISSVSEPTPWCSGMVCVPKPNGRVRICVDFTQLNLSVKREVHPIPSVDASLAKLTGCQLFSKLDANSGFWQLPLDEESRLLTTFITPFGRFCFNRLPFGISSAPEIFQRKMSEILCGLPGLICHMDDILIFGKDAKEHDTRVRSVLSRLRKAGVTLNEKKCLFSQTHLHFLGHLVSPTGIEVDPEKVVAIKQFPAPTNVTELQRFQGMVNQLAKFLPDLANINKPLRQLLQKDQEWVWGCTQGQAFTKIKESLASTEMLAHYDAKRHTIIAADACAYGLGAVLLQVNEAGQRRPICYASRSLTETEQRYAVIEKEALAAVWACEKFSDYVIGLHFTLETDHKPLVPLLSTKDLSEMPPRILRFRLRMMRFSTTVSFIKGKEQITADALSRAPVSCPTALDVMFVDDVEHFSTATTLEILPATATQQERIRLAQDADAKCAEVKHLCVSCWPAYMPRQSALQPYWENRARLTIVGGILLMDNRFVIPESLQLEMLQKIHAGHLGIVKCRARARESIWWPGMSKEIEHLVSHCVPCAKVRPEKIEPLLPSSFPSRPWERVATDLFEHHGSGYVLVVDYFSRWVEIRPLVDSTSETTIKAIKSIFSVHGIPDVVMSDNGTQYSSAAFANFAKAYCFTHKTSSPRYPQANGEAERAVRTIKEILEKGGDPYLGMLAYRATPLQNGSSPSQLLMGRRLQTTLPSPPQNLIHDQEIDPKLQNKERSYRSQYEHQFNSRHKAALQSQLATGDPVWVRDQDCHGTIVSGGPNPRSYVVHTDHGTDLRRNRRSLVSMGTLPPLPDPGITSPPGVLSPRPIPEPELVQSDADNPVTHTRSGRRVIAPERLDL